MADRRTPTRRTGFALREFALPLWRRPGFWQAALASLALVPLLWAAFVRLAPVEPVARDVAAQGGPDASVLPRLSRQGADADRLGAISALNLFSPDRQDWVIAVADAQTPQVDDASLKAAQEALDKTGFVGVFRVGGQWRAMLDFPGRAPDQDLAVIGPGDEYQSWTAVQIDRDRAVFEFRGTERTLLLRPKQALRSPGRAEGPRRGRAEVSAAPAQTRREMFYEAPITLDEARRQLRDALKDDPPEVIRRLEELFRTLEDGA